LNQKLSFPNFEALIGAILSLTHQHRRKTSSKEARKKDQTPTNAKNHENRPPLDVQALTGSGEDWGLQILAQALGADSNTHKPGAKLDNVSGATFAALRGIGPKDGLEGILAIQLIAAHNAAMDCYEKAAFFEQYTEVRMANLRMATKLSENSTKLVEALNRHRGKGQQKVTVEHVHVHAGGKAVVGSGPINYLELDCCA